MPPLLLSSQPYYDQYGTSNNFKADQSDDSDDQARGRRRRQPRPRRAQHPAAPPRGWSPKPDYPPSRRFRWYPKSSDGKRNLTFELNLGSKKSSANGLRWKPRTNTWPDLSPETSSRTLERINILASTTYSDEQGDAAVEIQSDPEKGNQDAHFIHWLHIQRENMDLDEFERLALQSPQISDEMALVVGHLMTKVRKELENTFVHGRYMLPGALRCDGLDPGNSEKEDISATWVCIPYFSMETPDVSRTKTSPTSSLHPLRTLLQSCYDFESTIDRGSNQRGRRVAEDEGGNKIVHLPQLWCLILGTETIISSAQTGLDALSKPAISRTIFTGDSDKAGLVKIIDPYKRQFFFPIKSCRTFYELKELVVEQCLKDISLSIEDYEFVYNKKVFDSRSWMDIIRSARSLIIAVSVIESKERGSPKPSKELSAYYRPHRPGKPRGVGETSSNLSTSDSSDSSSDEDIEVILAEAKMKESQGRQPHIPINNQLIQLPQLRPFRRPSASRRRSKERQLNLEKVQELTRSGLIINEPDSVAVKKTVKMYSLKPETKVPIQPHVQESLHDDPKYVPEQSSQQASVAGDKWRSSQGRTETPDIGCVKTNIQSENPTVTPKLALRAPPFFTWSLESASEKSSKAKTTGDSPESRGLKHILSRVETKITRPDFNLVGGQRGLFEEEEDSFKRSNFYKETPSIDLDELERLMKPLSKDLSGLRQRLALINSGSQIKTDAPTSSKATFVRNQQSEEDDPFVLQQKIALHNELQSFMDLAEDLVACFVPRSYDHSLLKKVWGALGTFITVKTTPYSSTGISLTCQQIISPESNPNRAFNSAPQSKSTPSSSKQAGKQIWTIRTFRKEDAAAAVSRGGKSLLSSKSTLDCSDCRDAVTYSSLADATKHLVTEHYETHNLTTAEQATVSILVLNGDQMGAEKLTSALLKIIEQCVVHLRSTTASAKEMLEVVAGASEESPDDEFVYSLPRTVVRSFQHNVIFMTIASHVIRLLEGHFRASNWTVQEGDGPSYIGLLSFLGFRAEISMANAMKDVILMVRTGETSESVNYAAVGPRYIAIVLYKNLLIRKLMKDAGLVDFYRKRTLKLQYDVYHKPARRRILGEIQLLHEELSAALAMRIGQVEAVCNFGWIGSAKSYRISNQYRNQQYNLESDVGQHCLDQLASEVEDLKLLLQRLATLEQKVRYRVEILEEDNSKAIFIFTVVAAIFLPLSFVTSYLGMNTFDIRNMNNSQSTFWAVAVPVTISVVALAVLAAYKGDLAREWLYERRNLFARPAVASGRLRANDEQLEESQGAKKRAKHSQEYV